MISKAVVFRPTLAALMVMATAGCQQERAKPQERDLGLGQLRQQLDDPPPLEWDELRKITTGKSASPLWQDPSWAHPTVSLAQRYAWNPNLTTLSKVPRTAYQQATEYELAIEEKKPEVLFALSPAEKLDFLLGRRQVPEALMSRLQSRAATEMADRRVESAFNELAEARRNYHELSEAVTAMRTEMDVIWNDATLDADTAKEKALAVLGKYTKYFNSLYLVTYQEAGKYWFEWDRILEPYTYENYSAKEDAYRNALLPHVNSDYSLNSTLARFLPLTGDGWRNWARTYMVGDYDYSGHCHGWAAAATREPAAKHALRVKKGDTEIILSQGDIRGYFVKAWADQAPGWTIYAGNRCNVPSEEAAVDAYGRLADGGYCESADLKQCKTDGELTAFTVVRNRLDRNRLHIRNLTTGKREIAYVTGRRDNGTMQIRLFDNETQLFAYRSGWNRAAGRPAYARLTANCRDLNPASFHLTLADLLGRKNTGLVAETSRFREVWNYPIGSFEVKFEAIPTKDGSTFEPGEPVPVEKVKDAFAGFRAPGTRYLVQMQTTYSSIQVPVEAEIVYLDAAEDPNYITYTLELDANRRLIGGEWGPVPIVGTEETPAVRENRNADNIPDFLWFYPKEARLLDGHVPVKFLDRLRTCIQQPPTGTVEQLDKTGTPIQLQVSDCSLADEPAPE